VLNGVWYSKHYVEGKAQQMVLVLWVEWSVYSEFYEEDTAQQLDSGIVGWMECDTLNNMWKLLHSSCTELLWVQ